MSGPPDHRLVERMMHARIEAGTRKDRGELRYRVSPDIAQELHGELHFTAPSATGMYPGRLAGTLLIIDPTLPPGQWRLEPTGERALGG